MVTYFNKSDLVKFGKYLLSKERTERIEAAESKIPKEIRSKLVHDSDIENFLESIKKVD